MGTHFSYAIWEVYLAEEFCVSQHMWVSLVMCLLTRYNCSGETVSIRAIRGVMATIVLFAILFYTLLNVVLAPIKETGLSPVKLFRIPGVEPADLLEHTYDPVWRVTYVSFTYKSSLNCLVYSTY